MNNISDSNIISNQNNKSDKEKDIIDYNILVKFPRTKHIINLGGMTRDDLIFTQTKLKEFLNMELLIEEKIDGANLGIFLDKTTMKIMVQNRSHFVNSSYHEQFKLLDNWINTHYAELYTILENNEYILYGEWMYFKHSIHYTNLPDYFILFDIYDRTTKEFFSRDIVDSIIKNTTLKQTPIIAKGKFTLEELKNFTKNKSSFYDGIVEGIYVRTIKDNFTKFRGKIVRKNFIAGNEHWTKNKYILNIKKN